MSDAQPFIHQSKQLSEVESVRIFRGASAIGDRDDSGIVTELPSHNPQGVSGDISVRSTGHFH